MTEHPHYCRPIPVVYEDEIIHTDEHPLCEDQDCPCWEAYYEAQERAEAANIERGFTERHDQLPEYHETQDEEAMPGGSEDADPRYWHSLYFETMCEAQEAYEVVDEYLWEVILEMECVPDRDRRCAELRWCTAGPFSPRDQAAILQLVEPTKAHVFNKQE